MKLPSRRAMPNGPAGGAATAGHSIRSMTSHLSCSGSAKSGVFQVMSPAEAEATSPWRVLAVLPAQDGRLPGGGLGRIGGGLLALTHVHETAASDDDATLKDLPDLENLICGLRRSGGRRVDHRGVYRVELVDVLGRDRGKVDFELVRRNGRQQQREQQIEDGLHRS